MACDLVYNPTSVILGERRPISFLGWCDVRAARASSYRSDVFLISFQIEDMEKFLIFLTVPPGSQRPLA